MRRGLAIGVGLFFLVGLLWVGQDTLQTKADAQSANVEAPVFEVDPFWPKPLPNAWRIGSTIGVWVDDQDLVWIVHRSSATLGNNERQMELSPPQSEECCIGAPPILAFDQEGNLVHAWGARPGEQYQGFTWPQSNHGIFVDHLGYVWMGANGAADSHIMKFTKDGRAVAQFGQAGARQSGTNPAGQPTFTANSNDPVSFGRVAKVFVDRAQNEVYLADGYLNRRVAVLDPDNGQIRRYWGAYGNRPDDSYTFPPSGNDDTNRPQQFRSPVHCADVSDDGLVYVCDRAGTRIQVFQRDGTFVREGYFSPRTTGSGSTWDLAFSSDPQQRYLFVADGVNEKVRVVLRETLQELTNFGVGGRQPGQFYGVHSIATDSRGNIYTTETFEGKRVQRFLNRGMGQVPAVQGAPWPR